MINFFRTLLTNIKQAHINRKTLRLRLAFFEQQDLFNQLDDLNGILRDKNLDPKERRSFNHSRDKTFRRYKKVTDLLNKNSVGIEFADKWDLPKIDPPRNKLDQNSPYAKMLQRGKERQKALEAIKTTPEYRAALQQEIDEVAVIESANRPMNDFLEKFENDKGKS